MGSGDTQRAPGGSWLGVGCGKLCSPRRSLSGLGGEGLGGRCATSPRAQHKKVRDERRWRFGQETELQWRGGHFSAFFHDVWQESLAGLGERAAGRFRDTFERRKLSAGADLTQNTAHQAGWELRLSHGGTTAQSKGVLGPKVGAQQVISRTPSHAALETGRCDLRRAARVKDPGAP